MMVAETMLASAPVQQAVCNNKQIYCWRSNTLATGDIGWRNSSGFGGGTMSSDANCNGNNNQYLIIKQTTIN